MGLVDLQPQKLRRSPEDVLRHLQRFSPELKSSAGIWFFSPDASRSHDRHTPEHSIEERLGIAASLRDDGLGGLEAHYPNEISCQNPDLWKVFSRNTGVILMVSPLAHPG